MHRRAGRPAAGRKDRDKFVSGKTKQNAVKSMVLTDAEGRVLFCSPVRPGSCADITQARQLGLAQLLAGGSFMEILADAGYQGMGAQTGGRVVTPPHRKFKKDAPAWYEERHEQQRKAHSEWLGEQGVGAMIRVDAERMRDGQSAWTFAASGGPLDGGMRADGASAAECMGRALLGLREAGLVVPF